MTPAAETLLIMAEANPRMIVPPAFNRAANYLANHGLAIVHVGLRHIILTPIGVSTARATAATYAIMEA